MHGDSSPQPIRPKIAGSAFVSGPVLHHPDRTLLRLTGGDRLKWLQGLVTCELTTMSAGQGCFTAACNRQGKMVGVMVVHLQEEQILLEVERSNRESLCAHFERYLIMEDVRIGDLSGEWNIRELHGSDVWAALNLSPPAWHHHVSWKGGFAVSNRCLGEEGATLLIPASEEVSFIGPDELPMEAGLEPLAISYNKGCYLGQEVILRVRNFGEPPKQLVLMRGVKPSPGSLVKSGEEEIGKVTSSSGEVSLGYVKKQWKSPGTELEIDGGVVKVEALPWHRHAERPPDREQGNVSSV